MFESTVNKKKTMNSNKTSVSTIKENKDNDMNDMWNTHTNYLCNLVIITLI